MFNPITQQNLELDMYNKELNLAVEYNGEQHYKYNKFMHQNSYEKFRMQQYRDNLKKQICQQLQINLIEVPYTIKHKDIERYLVDNIKRLGY